MSDSSFPARAPGDGAVAHGELISPAPAHPGGPPAGEADTDRREAVEEPAKVMRIGSMTKQLLEEVRGAPLDEAARGRLREIYETSLAELGSALSPDLREELDRLSSPFGEEDGPVPSEGELRIAQAQLVGWLEGLFHGIQATLFAQQMAARAQLEDMRRQLGPGGQATHPTAVDRPGTYL
ncbi:MAG: bacterial proteasome activator family protein [Actinobacteria bacterium]|nr:bacterial proteasome activator family protein [Actinomycetota bacterium]